MQGINAGDTGLIPGLRRSPGGGNDNPFLPEKNSMDKGAWLATVHGFAKSRTRLSNRAHKNKRADEYGWIREKTKNGTWFSCCPGWG